MKDVIRLIEILHILGKSRLDVLFKVKRKAKLNILLILTYPWRIYSLNKPRGERVREALEEAGNGNINSFQKLLHITSNPYQQKDNLDKFMKPPKASFEENFQTYCGT